MKENLTAFKKAVLAGVFIGIGCTVYLYMENKYLASFLFGLGLFTIINFKLNLFTGKIGYLSKDNYSSTIHQANPDHRKSNGICGACGKCQNK